MTIDRLVMVFAGTFIFTGFCPLAIVLKKMGVKSGCAF
jgi:hypothetical protein